MSRIRAASGKLTADIKTMIDDETKEELMRLARSEGLSLSEYLRDLVVIHVHGRQHLLRLTKARLERMAGPEQDMGD